MKLLQHLSIAVLSLCVFTSCAYGNKDSYVKTPPRKGVLYFIPGYYGTQLVHEKTGETFFITAGEALFGQKSLLLPIPGWQGKSFEPLKTSGILKEVPILGSWWTKDVYGGFLKQIQAWAKSQNILVVEVEYDWRQGLDVSLASIKKQIQSHQPAPHEFVGLIGHSMGGLLTAHLVHSNEISIDAVVMAAPALRGTPQLLRNSLVGTSQGWNKALLAREVVSSFPSTYMMLPPAPYWEIVERTSEQLRAPDIHNESFWQSAQWGLFQPGLPVSDESLEQRREWTKHQLQVGKSLWETLFSDPVPAAQSTPKLFILQGKGTLTNDRPHIAGFDFSTISFQEKTNGFQGSTHVDGDGTLSLKSTEPLPWMKKWRTRVEQKKLGHLEVLSERESVLLIQDFLQEAMANGNTDQIKNTLQGH